MPTNAVRSPGDFTRHVIVPLVLLAAVMMALGFLITKPLAQTWPLTIEDQLVRTLVAHRTPVLTDVSVAFSTFGSTMGILVSTALVAGLMRLAYTRWRESVFVISAVCGQLAVFLATTFVIHRDRPQVPHLDAFPPTSSFPSGHTSAAIALCGAIAIVLFVRAQRKAAAALTVMVLMSIPVLVGLARMYRGMHHPTDVAGSFVYGLSCLWVMKRAVFGSSAEYRNYSGEVGGLRPHA